jgi:hypothetical protein
MAANRYRRGPSPALRVPAHARRWLPARKASCDVRQAWLSTGFRMRSSGSPNMRAAASARQKLKGVNAMSTALEVLAVFAVVIWCEACIVIVMMAASFYTVGKHDRVSLECLIGAVRPDLLRPRALDAFLARRWGEDIQRLVLRSIATPWWSLALDPPDERERKRLRELAHKLRHARRVPTETAHVDRAAVALLGDPDRVGALQEERDRLHRAALERMRARVAASANAADVIYFARSWIRWEATRLIGTGFRDVAIPAIKRMMHQALEPTGVGGVAGAVVGAVVFVVLSGLGQQPGLLTYLGEGGTIGLGLGLAATVARFLRNVLAANLADEGPLLRAGLAVVLGGFFLYPAVVFSLDSHEVKYDDLAGYCVLVGVEMVGLAVLGAALVLRRREESASQMGQRR